MARPIVHGCIVALMAAYMAGCGNAGTADVAASGGKIDITPLRDFSTKYQPVIDSESRCPSLPAPPADVVKVLQGHPIDDEYCRHVSLVLLKLYRCHIENFSQSYDLRLPDPRNPFLLAFARMARAEDYWDTNRLDYFGSSEILNWIGLHPYHLRDKRFDSEIRRVTAAHERAQSELEALRAKAATRAAPPN